MKIISIVSVCLLLTAGIFAQTAQEKDETSKLKKLSVAKVDADGNITENPEFFSVKDIPITTYVDLETDKPTMIRMEFIAVKAKGLRPNTKFFTARYKTKDGETGAVFTTKPKTLWAEGDYRVDIYLDTDLAGSREFKIANGK